MSFYYAEKIISEFSSMQGLALSLTTGAVCFQQANGEKWGVEVADDGSHLLLHHNFSGLRVGDSAWMNKLLELNADYSFMQGAWFGLHQATQSCRIFKVLQIDSLTANLMCEHLRGFIHLASVIKKDFSVGLG
ncbi:MULTISPECIES: type III secretion system chaperone [Pseudomonas]|uniref:Uncharacterized protein n=1 Tax=Pseudomonas putida NBRC 14164 TaxID=1211579 RepID=A0ABM7ECZ4_PSEPU|nr:MULTISPECIES: type III secretion system chaperone [Pseudomonas]MCX9135180.1 type III secretion system chaperone [Pseudomonas sp. DCB_PUT]MDD1970621.1 type III secretion system chaperone [Pseudomonas putida]MDO1462933.1 hypothetical protein [Pseudomonas putida]MDO1468310.1 hypothetical protein [Pseudomonas putida]NWD13616.1 CesT family type III secretion system chaperone [Pseudomonas putida]